MRIKRIVMMTSKASSNKLRDDENRFTAFGARRRESSPHLANGRSTARRTMTVLGENPC
jgi:hypothetical protein